MEEYQQVAVKLDAPVNTISVSSDNNHFLIGTTKGTAYHVSAINQVKYDLNLHENEDTEIIVECHPSKNLTLVAGLSITIYSFSNEGPKFI